MTVVLTIGASDSSGGSGIQADLRTFEALGVRGTTAVTAIEARGSGQVLRQLKLPGRIIEAQIDAVTREFDVGAVKIGPLPSWQCVGVVVARVRRRRLRNVVLQPGIISSDGERTLGARGVAAMRAALLPRARVVVLTAEEAGLLAEMGITSAGDPREAASRLMAKGVEAVLVTGLPGLALCLEQDGGMRELHRDADGTGTAAAGLLSAVIAARLALGETLAEAVGGSRGFNPGKLAKPVGDTDILEEE